MKNVLKSLTAATLAFALFGCESSSKVDIVKNGKLQAGSNITIGKAFDASFGSTSWTEGETAKGLKVVTFQGDVDKAFLTMVADAILDEGVTSLITLGNCVDSDFAGEMIGNTITAGLTSLLSLGKVDAGKAIAEPVAKRLQEKDLRLTVNFDFVDESSYKMGYIGFKSEDWNDCELMKIIDTDKFVKFVYSDHEYVKTEKLPKTEKAVTTITAPKEEVPAEPAVEAIPEAAPEAAPAEDTKKAAKAKKPAVKKQAEPEAPAAPAAQPEEAKKSKKRRG